jgi:hypothetical protein
MGRNGRHEPKRLGGHPPARVQYSLKRSGSKLTLVSVANTAALMKESTSGVARPVVECAKVAHAARPCSDKNTCVLNAVSTVRHQVGQYLENTRCADKLAANVSKTSQGCSYIGGFKSCKACCMHIRS